MNRPLNRIFLTLKRCTAAKIQFFSSVSWFLIPMTVDVAFAVLVQIKTVLAYNIIHIPFKQFHLLITPHCLLIAAISTKPNNNLHIGKFLIRYLLVFCLKAVFAGFTFYSFSSTLLPHILLLFHKLGRVKNMRVQPFFWTVHFDSSG